MNIDLTQIVSEVVCGGCFAEPENDNACNECGASKMCVQIEKVLEKEIKALIREWEQNLAP